MLQVKELNLEEIKTIYDTHMQEAFPQSELRPYKNIEMLTKQGYYVCFGLYENKELLAYAFFTKSADRKYCLLDYYAVVDGLRGKGIGSAFFPLLKEKMQDMDGILIEVESVESTDLDEEKALRHRRIAFYQKNGCKMTKAKCLLYGVDFCIMALPVQKAVPCDEEVLFELEYFYHIMFDEQLYPRVCHPFLSV